VHHHLIDHLAFGDSVLHRYDPRAKIILCLLIIIAAVTNQIKTWSNFIVIFGILLIAIAFGKLPFALVLKRSLIVMPFVLFVVLIRIFTPGTPVIRFGHLAITKEGLWLALSIGIKSLLSVIAIMVLVTTTRFVDLLQGLQKWKISGLFISLLGFLYRYLFVLVDEVMRLKRAFDARSGNIPRKEYLRILGQIIGVLFIRTYSRAERIYQAMLARGYNGRILSFNQLSWHSKDTILLASVSFIIFISYLLQLWLQRSA